MVIAWALVPGESARRVRALGGARGLAVALVLLLASGAPARASDEPELELTGMTFVGSEEGRNDLLLTAEDGRYDPDEHVVYLTRIHVRTEDESGRPSLEMTSDEGQLWLDSSDFRASGDVKGTTGDGRRFRTEWVVYDRSRGRVRTDAPVVIRDGNVTLRGGGFRYDVRAQNLRLVGGASVVQP